MDLVVHPGYGRCKSTSLTLLYRDCWVTMGLHDTAQTIVWKESRGMGYPYVVSGPLVEFAEEVNRQLMAKDGQQGRQPSYLVPIRSLSYFCLVSCISAYPRILSAY